MKIKPFATEEFFSLYEFTTPYMLSASDCESMSVGDLLALASVSLSALGECALHYTESQGGAAVREAIAARDVHVHPDEVVMLNSPQEGIYVTMRALLEPGDHVLAVTPCYDSLTQVAEHMGCHVHAHALRCTTSGWSLDVGAFEAQLVRHRPRVVVVNFPNNPTGYLPGAATWSRIQELVAAHGATLFSDEMYRGLELRGRERLVSAADVQGMRQTHVTLAGLSKSHGLPGLRSGWLVIPDAAQRAQVLAWKHYTSICPPAPVEWLTRIALSVERELWARHSQQIEANVELVNRFMARHEGVFGWHEPMAGTTALMTTPWDDVEVYAHDLAKRAGVMALPAKTLGASANTIRLGLGRMGFGEALEQFERTLR